MQSHVMEREGIVNVDREGCNNVISHAIHAVRPEVHMYMNVEQRVLIGNVQSFRLRVITGMPKSSLLTTLSVVCQVILTTIAEVVVHKCAKHLVCAKSSLQTVVAEVVV